MAGTGTLTVTPDTGSGTVTINTLPPSGQSTGANSLPVVLASDQTKVPVAQPDVLATGTVASATSNAAYAVPLANGEGVVRYAVTGLTASAAVLISEASNDGGTTWAPVNLISKVFGDGVFSTTMAVDGSYAINAGGHTNVRLRVSTVGTGTINVASVASSQNPLVALSGPVTTTPAGLGAMQAVPAGSTNGTALGVAPAGARGARLYLPSGASITFTVTASAPTAAPGSTFTVSASGTGPNWDEDLAGGQMIYVTATAGSPLFRWR